MRMKNISIFTIISIMTLIFSFFIVINVDAENEYYVDIEFFGTSVGTSEKPFRNLQDAIDRAEDGDTIYIFSGLYEMDKKLEIDKKLRIIGGIDNKDTIIYPKFDIRYAVELTADEITIEGVSFYDYNNVMISPIGAILHITSSNNRIVRNNFSVTESNSTDNVNNPAGIYIESPSSDNLISGNIFNNTKTGIWLYSSPTNDIVKNNIKNSSEFGINIDSSGDNNRMYGNTIKNCSGTGIKVRNSIDTNITNNTIIFCNDYGVHSLYNQNTVISKNSFRNNSGAGVYESSSQDTITDNIFISNVRGITLVGDYNHIENNSFINSTGTGISAQSSSAGNLIIENKFSDNSISAQENGINGWYHDQAGNYWSDYGYVDLLLLNGSEGSDGIGDIPYESNGIYDMYPLGFFLKPPRQPSDPSPEDFATDVSLDVTLKAYIQDNDSEELTVYFYKGEKNGTIFNLINSYTANPVRRVSRNSYAECSFKLSFNTTFAWKVVVDDGILQNESEVLLFYTDVTPTDNIPPIADPGGPYQGEAGVSLEFDASESYDPDGKIDFYRWNFGDGTSEILQKNTSHIFKYEDIYDVTLSVIDDNGSVDTEVIRVVVGPNTNLPPLASIIGPSEAYVGEAVSFISSSTDPDGDLLNYTWDINGIKYYNPVVQHEFDSAGEYIVKLIVYDGLEVNITQELVSVSFKQKEETPGFELVIAIIAAFTILVFMRKRKNK